MRAGGPVGEGTVKRNQSEHGEDETDVIQR